MRLKSEILYDFLKAILIPILMLSCISIMIFQITFKSFINNEQMNKQRKIEELTKNLFIDQQIGLKKQNIDKYIWYLSELDLDVIFYDNSGREMYSFTDGAEYLKNNYEHTTKIKDVYDLKGKKLGQIKYIYRKKNQLNSRGEIFVTNLFRFMIISLFLSYITSLVISTFLSKKITYPIEELTSATVRIRKQNYDVPSIKSTIVEVNQLSDNINYMANSLKTQEFTRKEYAQNISHELRTPLTNLRVNLELMEDDIVEANKDNIQTLLVEIDRLTSLINQLNNTFKSANPETQYNPEIFNLTEFLNVIYKSMKTQFDNANVILNMEISEDLDIKTDKEKLSNILLNLLSNALKACQESDNVLLKARHVNKKIVISVKDTGIGISEENKPKIFERFFRVDDSRNTKKNGYGLGLSIVKNYADIIGADIAVNSKLNLGTVILISFDDDIIV
ncbi:cell wall metabolism sensor histidine kinase WalK [uncultured Finegoldia sp.]|uniref:sensor histidine kinase n=1 Tax=uncultured Finegoldia sp. TaxID=328009 RepID=UPI0026271968|nr:HAMP domain-containing sensor histidine kinase [uncultured Finegoldia sp.]